MSTTPQTSYSSVLSVNPYQETYFNSVASFINEENDPSYAKDQFVISFLNTKEFITAQIEISKNIPQEDLYDAISNKAYDELALDQAVEYKIQFIEIFENLDEENRHFHIFIVDPLTIINRFENVIEKIKYIDVIIPAPLLIKSLYAKEILDSSGVHSFIYIQENDAALTIYRNKEFVYTKSIKYSYIDMHERFCELYGERIPYEEFLNFITKTNLKTTDSPYKKYIFRLYKELISNINDILTYAKRAFEIEKFEHIYIGNQEDTQSKIHELVEFELSLPASDFDFDYGFEKSDAIFVNQMHSLMQLYTLIPSEDRYECNFTNYQRPPRFIRRESGKLIILTIASFVLAFIYPVTYWSLTYAQNLQKSLLKQEFKEVHNQKITREATIRSKLADKEKAIKLLKQEEKEYNEKKNTLIKIHKVKVDYPMKAKLISEFSRDLTKFNVHVATISYFEKEKDGKTLQLDLIANHDRDITKLVEYLTKEYSQKYDFNLKEIKYDPKLKAYLSSLKVKLL